VLKLKKNNSGPKRLKLFIWELLITVCVT